MAPPTIVTILICEHLVEGRLCGRWVSILRGAELPVCHSCKRPDKRYRLATDPEIAARDQAFLRSIERFGIRDPTTG